MRIKLDMNVMKYISLFENFTRAKVKDCIEQEGRLVFIVQKGEIGKAIGKNGLNIKKLTNMLKKKIKIAEYDEEITTFVKNVIMPNKASNIKEEEGIITIIPIDTNTRGLLIGRGAINLKAYEEIKKRFFEIKKIRVI